MIVRLVLAVVVAVSLPAPAASAVVEFAAPAGSLPAGRLPGTPFDAILPSGRVVTPVGTSVVTGTNASAFALTPDGRFAVVANAGGLPGESSLTVVDAATMGVVGNVAAGVTAAFTGVAAVRDPRAPERTLVFAAAGAAGVADVFDLDRSGLPVPDAAPVVSVAAPPAADALPQAPAALVAASDGRSVYAIGVPAGAITPIDTATRTLRGSAVAVGCDPFGAAFARKRLLVTNEGLTAYASVASAPLEPPFRAAAADARGASSLSLIDLLPTGDLAAPASGVPAITLDAAPDGDKIVGAAHPTAIAVTAGAAYAFVAMTNVDRIATVALAGEPHVAGGTELRLFDRGPYGTQPAALALSADGTRLYVALAGLNAVAVLDARDPLHVHRLGLIPTGATPRALALAADDRTLFVLNAGGAGRDAGSSAPLSTLEKIDLGAVTLSEATRRALRNARDIRTEPPHYPQALRDVVVIAAGGATFDAVLGDLGYGPADPGDVRFGESVTPNLHALARRFGVAANLFAEGSGSCTAHQWLDAGIATQFAQRALPAGGCAGERPEVYPRAGYIFNELARHDLSFRDYGDLVRLAGYDDGEAVEPRIDDPLYAGVAERQTPTEGLGGRYAADVPAPAVLAGNIDPNYPGWNARIRAERRAREFIRDFGLRLRARGVPRYTHIWLPLASAAVGPDVPSPAEQVADADRALGAIVAYVTNLPSWRDTAIFIVGDGAGIGPDHVDPDRTFALVVSPYARRHFVGPQHLSTVSVLKTAEQILGLPPLALGDLLATDMSDFFTPELDDRPYAQIPVPSQAATGRRALPPVDPEHTEAMRSTTGNRGSTPNALGNVLVRTETTNGIRGAKAL